MASGVICGCRGDLQPGIWMMLFRVIPHALYRLSLFTPASQAKRTAMCVALSNCDLCVLNSYDLKMVMKDFPNSSRQLEVRGCRVR